MTNDDRKMNPPPCCGVFYPGATAVNVARRTPAAVIIIPARPGRLDGVASWVRAEMPTGFAKNEIHNPAAIGPACFTRSGLDRVRLPILRSGQRTRGKTAWRQNHLSSFVGAGDVQLPASRRREFVVRRFLPDGRAADRVRSQESAIRPRPGGIVAAARRRENGRTDSARRDQIFGRPSDYGRRRHLHPPPNLRRTHGLPRCPRRDDDREPPDRSNYTRRDRWSERAAVAFCLPRRRRFARKLSLESGRVAAPHPRS